MCQASDMILALHSDASYLSKPKACSRVSGHFFLSMNTVFPPTIAPSITAQIIKHVLLAAVEVKLGVLFINIKQAIIIQWMLEEMGHLQLPTPIQTDNSTAYSIVNNKIIPKVTKAMDMHFHWLHDCKQQKQFRFYW